jgi:hypothetical protein
MEAGANVITMDAMQMGENCGTCHNGETAFGVMSCVRCHQEPPDPIVAPAAAEASADGTPDETPADQEGGTR